MLRMRLWRWWVVTVVRLVLYGCYSGGVRGGIFRFTAVKVAMAATSGTF